jgi:hypothetical protein
VEIIIDDICSMLIQCNIKCKTLAPFNEVSKTPTISELPEIAKTIEVKRLMGIEPYDFDDEEPNGPNLPKFIK